MIVFIRSGWNDTYSTTVICHGAIRSNPTDIQVIRIYNLTCIKNATDVIGYTNDGNIVTLAYFNCKIASKINTKVT